MPSKQVILVGGFHEIIEQVMELDVDLKGIIDNNKNGKYLEFPVLGSDSEARRILKNFPECELIITPDKGELRKQLYMEYSQHHNLFFKLISKYSIVSKFSNVDIGSIISQNVHISAGVSIGKFCKINVGANIMHDSVIADFTTVAPNAVILGNVKIGSNCYIGANSTILPNLEIGDNVVVGAGAVVTKNVKHNKVVKGIPAN